MFNTPRWVVVYLCVIATPVSLCAQSVESTNSFITQLRMRQLYGAAFEAQPNGDVVQVSGESAGPLPIQTAQYPIDSSVSEETYFPERSVPNPYVSPVTPYSAPGEFGYDPYELENDLQEQGVLYGPEVVCDGMHHMGCDCATTEPESTGLGISWSNHRITTTVLPGSDGGMGLTSVDLRTELFLKSFPLVKVGPRFSFHFLDGPDVVDVPNELYDTALDFKLFLPLSRTWIFIGGVAPGYFSDFEKGSSDAFRVTGRALWLYNYSEETQYTMGVVYLDRDDVSFLPAFGVRYSPAAIPELKFDMMFPKPKISYQLMQVDNWERSVYLGGEFGGGTWAVQRAGGASDSLTYRDLKLVIGLEEKQPDNFSWFVEAGYVFGREVEYESGQDYELDETGMVRVGMFY